MNLPTFNEAKDNVTLGLANPLEKFIYDNEPLETRDAAIWRQELVELLKWFRPVPSNCICEPVDHNQIELPMDQEPE